MSKDRSLGMLPGNRNGGNGVRPLPIYQIDTRMARMWLPRVNIDAGDLHQALNRFRTDTCDATWAAWDGNCGAMLRKAKWQIRGGFTWDQVASAKKEVSPGELQAQDKDDLGWRVDGPY